MKRLFFALVIILIGVKVSAQVSGDKILGKWINEDKTRIIEFVKNGSAYDAIIRKAENSDVIGRKQITQLVSAGEGTYNNGIIHVIKGNKTVNCKANLLTNGKLEIKGSKGLISKSQVWGRYNEVIKN